MRLDRLADRGAGGPDLLVAALLAYGVLEALLLDVGDASAEAVAAVLVALPLLGRRSAPLAAATASLTAVVVQQTLGLGGAPLHAQAAAVLLAGFTLGAVTGRHRRAGVEGAHVAVAFIAAGLVLAATGAGGWADATTQTHFMFAGVVLGGLALGYFPRERAARAAALRAEIAALERGVARDLAEASEVERTAIARHLEALVERVARRTGPLRHAGEDRRAATRALQAAERAAQDAIGELRELLSVLRETTPAEPCAPVRPSRAARIARFHARYGPVLVFAAIGTVEQVAIAELPVEIAAGVVVPEAPYPAGVAIALAWATALPLLLRHRRPLTAIAATAAFLVARMAIGDLSSLTWSQHAIGVGLAFAAGGYVRGTRPSLAGLATAATATASTWALEQAPVTAFEWLYLGVLLTGAWTAGRRMGVHLVAAVRGEGELTRLRARRADLAREAALLERRLVAREVHDLVGHGLTLMSMNAAVSAAQLEQGDDPVGDAVARVRDLAATTDRELTALLDVLRAPRDAVALPPELDASSGLERLRQLVTEARRHGHPVELRAGQLSVPAPVAHAVVDVVRESLTNVRKHAGPVPTEVAVSVDPGSDAVEVLVVNGPGRPSAGPGSRLGLAGLHERLREVRGRLEAGPTPSGGWQLRCVVPGESES